MGDWVSHCAETNEMVFKELQEATLIMQEFISSNVNVIPILGNNDVFPHNSMSLEEYSLYFHEVASLWDLWLSPMQQSEFKRGGFYTSFPVPGLRVIVMNTLVYYEKFCPFNSTIDTVKYCTDQNAPQFDIPDDPLHQFEWLLEQLHSAKKNNEK